MNEKRILEIEARLRELKAEGKDLLAKTDLTDEEIVQCKAIDTEIEALTEEKDKLVTDDQERAAAAVAARDGLQSRLGDLARTPTARALLPDGPVTEGVRDSREDDPQCGFRHFGEYAHAVYRMGLPGGQVDPRLHIAAAAGDGMTQGVADEGGVLVPSVFRSDVWDGAANMADSLIPRCDSIPIDAGAESVTFPAIDETSRADGSRNGGIRGYWKGEESQMSESKPSFRGVKWEPQELYVFAFASDKLLRNAPIALGQWLTSKMIDEINFKCGDAIINGTGVGMPKGILNGTSGTDSPRVRVTKESGQKAATLLKANIDKMWSRMWAKARAGAIWLINQDVEPQLDALAAAVGTGGVPAYLPPGGLADTPFARLKGRPVVPIEYAATLGTEGDIMLVNLKYYGVAFKGSPNAAASMHLKFDYAQTAFRVIWEIDGNPWLRDPLTPFKGTNTQSPFVTLQTRS